MLPRSLLHLSTDDLYQNFLGLLDPEKGDSKFLSNDSNYSPLDAVSYHGRPDSSQQFYNKRTIANFHSVLLDKLIVAQFVNQSYWTRKSFTRAWQTHTYPIHTCTNYTHFNTCLPGTSKSPNRLLSSIFSFYVLHQILSQTCVLRSQST